MSDLEVTTSGRGRATLDEPSGEKNERSSSSIRKLGSMFGVSNILRNKCSSSGLGAGIVRPHKTRMGTHLRLRGGVKKQNV